MQAARKDLKELYTKTKLKTNTSCGLHVHVSFKTPEDENAIFSTKFVQEFQAYASEKNNERNVVARLARWHNTYCPVYDSVWFDKDTIQETYAGNGEKRSFVHDLDAVGQELLKSHRGHRPMKETVETSTGPARLLMPSRAFVNFWSYTEHNTIEIRAFRGAKSWKEAVALIRDLTGFMDSWLETNKGYVPDTLAKKTKTVKSHPVKVVTTR
jgi:hypothetical protein